MKKTTIIIVFLILFPTVKYAIDFDIGIFYGLRTVNDPDIKNIYGNGTVYFPYLSINIWNGFTIGGGYEGGYSKEAEIGLYNESSILNVTGMEFFIGYQLKIKNISPYIKIGYGTFSYKQTVENPYVEDYKVDHKKTTMTIGGGLKFYPIKHLFIGGEIKFVPLKVNPYVEEVDLGGIRYLVCIGYTFNI
jgi:opacity protein-like surface antigen